MTEQTIFLAALDISGSAERSAYLERACAGDPVLRRQVEALLAAHERSGAFLDIPALEQIGAGLAPPVNDSVALEPDAEGAEKVAKQGDPAQTQAEQQGEETNILAYLQPSTRPGALGRLGHYEVLEVLGQGGFGIVVKAFDEKLHRLVAIKIMAPHLAVTSPPRKRFLREVRSAAAIRHENVVGIYAVEEQPLPFLVMEYIAGETLQQKLDRVGPLEVTEVLRIGQQIASGLAAAHALGLIHRDIKPANILLENGVEQRVKLTDFGLARTADDASLTQSGMIAGTPLYMSPEQAQGEAIDPRADLFSLGSVLYVMCSGRPPFRASSTLAILKRVAEDTPRPIREIIPEVPKWLCAIVERLHAKNPADRFASAKEVADLLARHLAKLQQDRGPRPISKAPRSPAPAPASSKPVKSPRPEVKEKHQPAPTVRPPLRRRWHWAAAAGVLFLLLAGLSLSEATGVTHVWGTVIRLFSPSGTLVVEVDDPGVSVSIDGEALVITGAGAKEIRIKPGEHKIQASKDGKLVSQELVTVSRNGRVVVRVSKEAGPIAEANKGEKPADAQKPRPPTPRPLDLKYIPADASAALVIHPRRILQSTLAGALPRTAPDEMGKELGVKPEQIEQVIVFLQTGTTAAPAAAPPAAPPPPKDGWTELGSREGRFSVRFPIKPKASERKTTLGTRQVFTAETDEGNLTFELSYVDFPKDSPFVGDQSRVDFATRALEFKPGFKDKKDIKLDNHPGAEVVLDDDLVGRSSPFKTYAVHRVYVVGDRLYNLEATSRKAQKSPAEFARFFDSFKVTGAANPPPAGPPPDLTPFPGAIIRFTAPTDGKRILTSLLKGLREESRDGKTYYRSSSGEALMGQPLAGAVPDQRTILVAPESVLRKMLAAGTEARSPLLDRLRQTDTKDEVTGIVILEPYRNLLNALVGPFKAQLPADFADVAKIPDRVVALTAAVNLGGKTLFKVSLEADNEQSVEVLDNLAFKGLNLARKVYPEFRPTMIRQIPARVLQPVLAVADQLFGGIQVATEGKRLVIHLEKPEGLDTPPDKDLIASSGFNDARGMNSNPVPGSPFPLDIPNREGGLGEPGWKGPWVAHPDAVFQSKVVFEGDGAVSLRGRPNFGPNYMRQLAQAQTGRFQVEFYLQVAAGGGIGGYLWQDLHGGADHSGPNWGAGGGKFSVQGYPDTGFKILPDRWYKVTFRIDVPKQTWEFFLDDKHFESPQPLKFRAKVQYLDVINFLAGEGVTYIDALRVTRLGQTAPPRDVGPAPAREPAPATEPNKVSRPDRTPTGPRPIKPPPPIVYQVKLPQADKEQVPLLGPVADVAVGGGGRYLILRLAGKRKLALFDVQQSKVVKEVPLSEEVVHFAAGANRLVVVNPGAKVIQLWNLATFERERSVHLPDSLSSDSIRQVCMGSASAGPAFFYLPGQKRTLALNLDTLETTSVGWSQWGPNNAYGPLQMRASPDGTLLVGWGGGWAGSEVATFHEGLQTGTRGGFPFWASDDAFALPNADARWIYIPGGMVDRNFRLTKAPGGYLVPAMEPGYFLSLALDAYPTRGRGEVAVYTEERKLLFSLKDLDELKGKRDLPWEKCVYYYPRAGLLVTLGAEKDRLILRRVDLADQLEKSGTDYLVVLSRPPVARAGSVFTYQLDIRSKKGGVKVKLESGPPGLKVTPEGKVTWDMPANQADAPTEVLLTVSDGSGQETLHSFKIEIGQR